MAQTKASEKYQCCACTVTIGELCQFRCSVFHPRCWLREFAFLVYKVKRS